MATSNLREEDYAFISGRMCLDFVNTRRDRVRQEPSEHLRSYDDLLRWSVAASDLSDYDARALSTLAQSDPIGSAGVIRRAVRLREALFEVFVAVTCSETPSISDLGTVNGELERISPHLCCLRWTDTAPTLSWSTTLSLDRSLWNVLRSATELMVSSDRDRVKLCEHQTCTWLFVDETRNHTRRWCEMSVCGNRAKACRFRSRNARRERDRATSDSR